VTIPTTADFLGRDSSRAVLAATMLRIETPMYGITERLLATGQRSNTSPGRARKHLEPTTRWCRMAATATISDRLSRACDMRSNNLFQPLLMGQGKLFQQSLIKTMLLCPCTDNCKVATLHATTKSSLPCNEHLSSEKRCMQKLNEGFGRVHDAGASKEAHYQTVEHTPRYAMRCPRWSAKNASSDTATLLLRPFPHGFLHAQMRLH
jgi:hypothetical protein